MAPALAAGNTFVIKSSEKSPLALAAYGELVKEAGFPPGVINILSGAGAVGAMLASHMDIAKIAFTGSVSCTISGKTSTRLTPSPGWNW